MLFRELTLRITSGVLSNHVGRRLVHAMLDGVFECRNHFFDVRRQLATTLDLWPQSDRRGQNRGAVQRNGIQMYVPRSSARNTSAPRLKLCA
jgi:hypothetical protein